MLIDSLVVVLIHSSKSLGKLPQKLKRLKVEFVNVEAYEKIKVYGVTDRAHFVSHYVI